MARVEEEANEDGVVQLEETMDEPVADGQEEDQVENDKSPERPEETKSRMTKISTVPQKLNSKRLGQFNTGKILKQQQEEVDSIFE